MAGTHDGVSGQHGPEDPAWAREILRQLAQQNDNLSTLARELTDLRRATNRKDDPMHAQAERDQLREEYHRQWQEEILPYQMAENLRVAFVGPGEAMSLAQLLSQHRPWEWWAYRASYPKFSALLQDASLTESSRSRVSCEDFDLSATVRRWDSAGNVLDQESLWSAMRTRAGRANVHEDVSQDITPSRMVRVIDLSPIVAAIILGSTPKFNLSYMAKFFERYLAFANWGQATLLGLSSKTMNCFVFEYHFAFFFVPKSLMDPDLAVKDFRRLRKCAAFGPHLMHRSRYIYEEKLSIILIGYGREVYTCYQLAEKYFVGPYIKGSDGGLLSVTPERSHMNSWTPTALFLSWLMMALHHVRWRWQNAIEAIDAQIDSPSQIVFSDENPDLLSDDAHFSRSKTYFWALQAYKMFEENLIETIQTWEHFRGDALDRVNDGRINPSDWESAIRSIDNAIEKLREKLSWIQKKSEEVTRLRDGLFGASSLFDNRTTVRQGDNIRLLTYITLLYLPLTFCTGVFGMETVLPRNLTMRSFAIALPAVTIFTALMIFNLHTFLDGWARLTSEVTSAMRQLMRNHQRVEWRRRANALHLDRMAHQTPVKRRPRESSHWFYLVFTIETLLVSLPVHELEWVVRGLNDFLLRPGMSMRRMLGLPAKSASTLPKNQSRAKRVKHVREAAKREDHIRVKHRRFKFLSLRFIKRIANIALFTLRVLLLPLWFAVVALEYNILLVLYFFHTPPQPPSGATPPLSSPRILHALRWPLAYLGFTVHHTDTAGEAASVEETPQNAAPTAKEGTRRRAVWSSPFQMNELDRRVKRWQRPRQMQAKGMGIEV